MTARRRWRLAIGTLLALVLVVVLPAIALAQTTPPPISETPEPVRGIPFWIALPFVAGGIGLVLLVAFSYWRLSSRFYGREEPPPPRQRPRYAGMSLAQPVAAAPQGAASARAGATAAAAAAGEAPAPPAPSAPSPAPSGAGASPAPAAKAAPAPAAEPIQEATAAAEPAAKPAPSGNEPAEQPAASGTEPAEQPAASAAKHAEQPAAARGEPSAAQASATQAAGAAGGQAEPDQETFDRVLQEQIEKGVDRRVAEGRARAAAIRAAREKAGAG